MGGNISSRILKMKRFRVYHVLSVIVLRKKRGPKCEFGFG